MNTRALSNFDPAICCSIGVRGPEIAAERPARTSLKLAVDPHRDVLPDSTVNVATCAGAGR